MAIIGNFNRLCQNPQLYLYAPSKENAMCTNGTQLNCRKGQSAAFTNFAAQPSGHYAPQAWLWPRVAGSIASRSLTFITLTLSGSGAEGLGGVGPATISLDTYASGTRLYWGRGSSSFLLSGTGSILSLLPLAGSTNITLSGSLIPNALGWLASGTSLISLLADGAASLGIGSSGSADISINATGEGTLLIGAVGNTTIYITSTGIMVSVVNISGSSPIVLSATLTPEGLGWVNSVSEIALSANLVAYGIGHMVGTTQDLTGLTTTSIADAVWQYSFGTATAQKTLEAVLAAVEASLALEQADQMHTAELITFRDRLTNALLLQKNVTGSKFGTGTMTMTG